ncbi:MAG: GGDEF domain-containing protein [Phycisphaerae bacterium]|nr:GGDEF domain-containing protein [Phycisphaerae bacterium]
MESAKLLRSSLWNIESGLAGLEDALDDQALKSAFQPAKDAALAWQRVAREHMIDRERQVAALSLTDFTGAAQVSPADPASVEAAYVAAQSQMGEFVERELRPTLFARAGAMRDVVAGMRAESLIPIGLVTLAGCALSVIVARTVRDQNVAARVIQDRQGFDARITNAMSMVQDENQAMRLIESVIEEIHPGLPAAVLVADSSRAHLHQTATTAAAESCNPLCSVRSPAHCPAVRRGFEIAFSSSKSFDACPHLRNRSTGDCSAACVPITIAGQHVGVLHAVTPENKPLSSDQVTLLTVIAAKAGERIGVIRAFSQSEDQATKDSLTGLLNRRSAEDMVQQLQRSNTPFCIVYADIDHFKRLNDTHGHETGDRVLRLFSRIMVESLRPSDVVARWGGEEFIMLLPHADMAQAQPIIERLRKAIESGTGTGSVPSITASFGIADCGPKDEFDERLNEADVALLNAKKSGRNRIVFAGSAGTPVLAATA